MAPAPCGVSSRPVFENLAKRPDASTTGIKRGLPERAELVRIRITAREATADEPPESNAEEGPEVK
jgi:hypothetical protein